eukprot:11154603-Lingulodinium_polyedra.AAC.1
MGAILCQKLLGKHRGSARTVIIAAIGPTCNNTDENNWHPQSMLLSPMANANTTALEFWPDHKTRANVMSTPRP